MHVLGFAAALTASLALGAASAPAASLPSLADAVCSRLQAVRDVAQIKWQQSLPILDTSREQAVIVLGRAEAEAVGLDPASIEDFVRALMAVSRDMQAHLMDQWQTSPPDAISAPDLTQQRQNIGRATEAGIRAVARQYPATRDRNFQKDLVTALQATCGDLPLDPRQLRSLARSLEAVRQVTPPGQTLDRIQRARILRVGTTGDYPPFSETTEKGYNGVDIQLARRLADSLGVQIKFVPTTWPTLMADLMAGHFDIAMSGISRIPARARYGFFSASYHQGGKAAITRCSNGRKYGSLPQIDRPATRVIVNRGGTNEVFVRENIVQAQVIIVDDNTATFPAIAAGQADVMITDAIEVAWQSARDRRLCPALPAGKTLTVSEKAFLMPQDTAWQHYVDVWLRQMILDGTVERLFKTELSGYGDDPAR